MALRTIVTFPFTIAAGINRPCLVQQFTVTFTSQTTRDTVNIGSQLDVSGKGSGYLAAIKETGTLEFQVFLVGFVGTRWAATDTVRLADGTPANVGTCDSDDNTDLKKDLGRYVSIVNDDTAGAGTNSVIQVGYTFDSSTTDPKISVAARDEYTLLCDNSSYVALAGTTSDEVAITIVNDG